MTRPFAVQNTCQHCGKQTSAETGFGRWMRACPELDSRKGIVRTDTDHMILRYKTHGDRSFQLLMLIETKEFGSRPRLDQRDILLILHQLLLANGKNMHGKKTVLTRKVRSVMNKTTISVRYMGMHLLVFEKTSPTDSKWIEWDRHRVTEDLLIQILALNVDPNDPSRPMQELLRDRHAMKKFPLFD